MAVHIAVGWGGGDSNIKMPGCVCQESETRPILKGRTFGHNDIIHVNNPYP